MTSYNIFLRNFRNTKHSKLLQRVSFAVLQLNRPNYLDCSKVSKLPFLPFVTLFYLGVMQPTRKIRPYLSSATSNEYDSQFCFQFLVNFHFNGHFRHFGRPYWIEDINGKRWFAIPSNVIRWRKLYVDLKLIALKLKTWECRK